MSKELGVMRIKTTPFLRLVFILLVTCYFLLPTSRAKASQLSLGVNPPIIQVNATPPTAIKQPLTIRNNSATPVTLSVTLRPFITKDTLGHATFLTEKELVLRDKTIFQKIQILSDDQPVDEITLDPQESKTLTLKIGLPKDEPPADYYFSIVFLSKTEENQANGPAIAGGIASNVLLSIGPKGPATGFIEKFLAPVYVTNGPIPFTVIVHNLSPYYISPQGQILIHNIYNQLIGKVDLLQENILSNSSRNLSDNQNLDPEKAIWPEKFLFGPYKATLTLSLSPQGPVYYRSIYFFALPIQYLIGCIVAILVAAFLLFRVRRRLRQS